MGRRSRVTGERGETLVEVLVAIAILGLAGVAVMAGLGLAVKSSDIGRKESTGGSYVRSYAEAIKNYVAAGNYINCAHANDYNVATVTNVAGVPAGYLATQSVAKSWFGTTWGACSSDPGVQQVILNVASADGRASESLAVILRRPCNGSLPSPC